MFLALRNGQLSARGELAYVMRPGIEKALWVNEESEEVWQEADPIPDEEILSTGAMYLAQVEGNNDAFERLAEQFPDRAERARARYESRLRQIPPAHWRLEGVDWENSKARSPEGLFMYISLDRESLFSVFPPPDPVAVQLNTYGGLIVLDEDADNLKSVQKGKRGRPPVIDWNAVHVELAKKASNGNLPDKQEACIAEMQQWCMDQWGLSPERSSLQTRISPYYKAFKKK